MENEKDQDVTKIASDEELKAIAKIMCDECPRASVQMDLFVDIFKEFGVANDQAVCGRVWEHMQIAMQKSTRPISSEEVVVVYVVVLVVVVVW